MLFGRGIDKEVVNQSRECKRSSGYFISIFTSLTSPIPLLWSNSIYTSISLEIDIGEIGRLC